MEEGLVALIIDQIITDEEPFEYRENDMIDFYNSLESEEKGIVDRLMIQLTGWRLCTLIEKNNKRSG